MEHTSSLQETPVSAPAMAPESTQPKKLKAPKKKRKWVKRLIIIAVLAVVIAVLLSRCMSAGKATLSGMYLVDSASTKDMTVSVSGKGTVEPIDSYKVTALVKGEILDAPFEENDTVEKDQLLFHIDSGDVENSISRAELALEQARLSYNQLLRSQKDTQLTANVDGVIQTLNFDPGDNIAAGSVVATILDNATMKLAVPFHASDAAGFHVGQAATVAVDGTVETLTGTVDEIAATDSVGMGGTLVRAVTLKVQNPGALDVTSTGTATVSGVTCAASASFEYAANKQVVAKTSGELASLYVKEGDRVSDGQTIGAFKGDTISDQIENARLSVRSAELSLQSARDNLDNYTIQAPIAGTIIEKNYKSGDNVDPTTTASSGASTYMAVIYDMSTLTFEMSINELDVSKLEVGQSVSFTTSAVEGKTFPGHVDKININGSTQNGSTSYPVTIVVDDPEGLFPGMNVSADIIVEKVGSVLSIPVEAVSRGNEVIVPLAGALDADGNLVDPTKVETRTVTLGRNDQSYIEVLEGLNEGDHVLIQNSSSSAMSMMMGG